MIKTIIPSICIIANYKHPNLPFFYTLILLRSNYLSAPRYFSHLFYPGRMSDGTLFKPDKDYTKEADKILPEAEALAKVQASVPCEILEADSGTERSPKRH